VGALLLSVLLVPTLMLGQRRDEYDVKAAFLINLAKFVDWPVPDRSSQVLAICIFGDDPFGRAIDLLTRDQIIQGRTVEIRRLRSASEAVGCQMAFVRSKEREKASALLQAVRGLPVLTVGEELEFAQLGGAIYLPTANNRVDIVINPSAVEDAGLRLSAKLMSLATILP
jgi:hypothetical protein